MSARLALLIAATALGAGASGAAFADPLPYPTVDFALKAKLKDGGSLDLAHSNGRMRVEMLPKASPSMLVGIVDLKAGKMAVMVPSMPKMAVEVELPPEYNFASLAGSGTKVGTAEIAGEACDLWKLDPPPGKTPVGSTTACITGDGISLRTETEIQGKPQLMYEVISVTRAPQEPTLFVLPHGVQTIKIPKTAAAGLPGLAPLLMAPAAPTPTAPAPTPAAPAQH